MDLLAYQMSEWDVVKDYVADCFRHISIWAYGLEGTVDYLFDSLVAPWTDPSKLTSTPAAGQ